MLRVFFLDEWAFTVLTNHELICIGTKADVDISTPRQIANMILEAIATAEYHAIDRKRQRIAH